jgi:hypothetical protein
MEQNNESVLTFKLPEGGEYIYRNLDALERALKFNDDLVNNRRRLNGASRSTKTAHKRRRKAVDKYEESFQ